MANAKVTSKGQVTVPVEVRRALGVETGDGLVFEVRGDYAVVRRVRDIREVAAELRERYAKPIPLHASEEEAVAAMFREEYEPGGDALYVVRAGSRARRVGA
ncbi:MAG: AbrB family transcriptional regulator [Coriobacteriaceae bacterium]|nr:AbrB family transcriptional regulator [Coriobacteriaceae bacterium]